MNPSIDDHLAAAHEMIDGRDAEIERLKETIRAFGRGDIVPITDKDAENERLRAALKTVQTFIAGEQIAHALVPEGDGGPDTWPTLGKVIARAFEQKASGE